MKQDATPCNTPPPAPSKDAAKTPRRKVDATAKPKDAHNLSLVEPAPRRPMKIEIDIARLDAYPRLRARAAWLEGCGHRLGSIARILDVDRTTVWRWSNESEYRLIRAEASLEMSSAVTKQQTGFMLGVTEELETHRIRRNLTKDELIRLHSIHAGQLTKVMEFEQQLALEGLRNPDPLGEIFESYKIVGNPEATPPQSPAGDDPGDGDDREDP